MKKNKANTTKIATTATTMPSDDEAARQIMRQYHTVIESEKACFKERVKFGAMLIQWEMYLGGTCGVNHAGEGLKGWLAINCPALPYTTATGYKTMAERVIKMLGGGRMAEAALLELGTVTQPDGQTVEVPEVVTKARDAIFEGVDSRRKLEQAWFDFVKAQGVEANKAQHPLKKLSRQEESKVIWTGVMNVLDKSAVMDAVPLLPGKVAKACLDRVSALRDALKRRVDEGQE